LELSYTKTLVYNFLVDDLHNYCVGKNEISVHNTNSPSESVTQKEFIYDKYVEQRALEDPRAHNFPYSFDEIILSTNPVKISAGYKIYQHEGYMNRKKGVFEIGITDDGVINHRFFRPSKPSK
jgi:hypothetical protein